MVASNTIKSDSARILVVDDNERMRKSLAALLEAHGYEVELADGGVQAQEWLERQHFDVAMLDLMMPDLDGFGVMRRLRERDIDTSVIVVSGDSSVDVAIEVLRAGAYDFVRKPYAPEVLLHAVENALEQRRLGQEREQMQRRMERSEQLHRYMVNKSPDIIYLLDSEGRFKFINDRVESLLGFSPRELIGKHHTALLPEGEVPAKDRFDERRGDSRRSKSVEMTLRCKQGGANPVVVENSAIQVELNAWGMYSSPEDGDRRFVGTYGIARDISGRKQAEETIRFQAYHDLLTQLPNRTQFKEYLEAALRRIQDQDDRLAVIYVDVDRLKIVNDQLGHLYGDEMLCTLATRLKACLRESDTLARIGGDEFGVLLPKVSGVEDAKRVAEKIIEILKEPVRLGEHELFASVSMGIAICPEHGLTVDALLTHADIAMYHGRDLARGSYGIYSTDMDGEFSRHLAIERGIRTGLDSGQFSLCFQPQVSSEHGNRLIGVEALVRWNHPEFGNVPPSEFVPVAEESGLIIMLGDWVLEQACLAMVEWRELGFNQVRMAINFSSIQVAQSDFAEKILIALNRHNLPGEMFEVEITENVLMSDMDSVSEKLGVLVKEGVTVAIDDFGTGYSSLSYLHSLPIQRIKIDRAFVRVIGETETESSIINAIVSMASGLGMEVIAEGVETDIQRSYLAQVGCEELQGFLFSKPVPSAEVTEILLNSVKKRA
ncbi:hypothetical protein BOW53_06445 [Solemya pervernicosa gill symbiont]|uniref:Two-component system response regulator n=2 Tax=Gammaproteobacteria incertae sedis TaxID=118884 RepID=A0A1T2L6P5_9GAMM|nr:EAL domain-containing protein [Candidatus Reidiella endopervernicosa]OOZ40753.1 hypothetical protein BOW53_06445 [Solemya pervernicosa gill symbiont]QKQ26417.1 EAL domain-containing protein [Candidatus Reidiella endopervernicosa]